ncbi:amidohydrolase family protein [Streptomyces sp. SID8361]|uniref:amidohydrolase family protein n=1 Tax=Streptomyces sp. MnatMP-M27 TaxID=1839768 RepID=UPI00081F2F94|nr:amidohydrolase family protein [Streptomyces sp. MnatMP-M27]MYU10056.1 amidohydrolase family protein [Streptomyces sp. SID8361]SCF67916.1 dihydroorotase [Streptomyces sp. MnatMP-M27]
MTDMAFVGARVIDPESGLDARRTVGVTGDKISYVGKSEIPALVTVDVSGYVLCPGFIDLHSHAQSVNGLRLQALDGVTTALELESGALPLPLTYASAVEEGRPINFGYSVSWAEARMLVMDGIPLPERSASGEIVRSIGFDEALSQPGSRLNSPASRSEVDQILVLLEQGIADGALGIGVLLGYAPDSGRGEYFRMAQLASRLGVGVFTHQREFSNVEPRTSLDGALEILGAAAGSGAGMHICHLNSTSARQIDEIAEAIEVARGLGNRITTEAYPYSSGSCSVNAAFLAPDRLHRLGVDTQDITYLPTGERIVDASRLRYLRDTNPEGIVVVDYLREDDPRDQAMLTRALTLPDTAIASDAMPLISDGVIDESTAWPPGPGAITHPRSLGCFARVMGRLVRERGVFSLPEAIRRSTHLPAQILEETAPAMKFKGRVQVGADADLTIFDPASVSDRATYESIEPSTGFAHVLVNGEFVVRDAELIVEARPGRPVKGRGC